MRDASSSGAFRDASRRLLWTASTARRTLRRKREPRPWPADAIALRRAFERRLRAIVAEGVDCAPPIGLHVVCFSSEQDVPEQVASARSFLASVGVPRQLTVVSDGSHSAGSRDLLRALHPCVDVVDWSSLLRPDLPRALLDYSRIGWRGKKVAALASLAVERPVFYTDSDVLFFTAAAELRSLAATGETAPRYLRDASGGVFLDRQLLLDPSEERDGVNSGVIFLPHRLDWSPALRRLAARRWKPTTFTGQTIVHLALHQAGARPFDATRYVVAVDDVDAAADLHAGPRVALRHYVTPVRAKFWTTASGLFENG
jgi:hypothetical protein